MPSPKVKRKTEIMMEEGRRKRASYGMQTLEIPNNPKMFIIKLIHLLNQ